MNAHGKAQVLIINAHKDVHIYFHLENLSGVRIKLKSLLNSFSIIQFWLEDKFFLF